MKEIALGFFIGSFYRMCREHDWVEYMQFSRAFDIEGTVTVIEHVEQACIKASKINFLLDGYYFNYPTNRYGWDMCHTADELNLIFTHQEYYGKTIFWLDGDPIDKEIVRKAYLNNTNIQL